MVDATTDISGTPSANLPTWDEALSGNHTQSQKLPTWDEAFKQQQPQQSALSTTLNFLKPPAFSTDNYSQINDATKQFLNNTSIGRIAGAFGHEVGQQIGDDELGLSKENRQQLADMGMLSGYKENQSGLIRSINDAIVLPAAATADAAFRTFNAAIGGTAAALEQVGEETGTNIPKYPAELLREFQAGAGMGGELHGVGYRPPSVPREVIRAKSLGVIGEGEAGYFETKEPTPQQTIAREQASSLLPSEALEKTEITPPAPEPQIDIHQIARNIAPDTFKEYDDLQSKQQELRNQIGGGFGNAIDTQIAELEKQQQELSRAPVGLEGDELHAAVTDNINKATELDARIKELKEDSVNNSIVAARAELQKIDYRMRDLAPDVSKAYRDAETYTPGEPTKGLEEPTPPLETTSPVVKQEPTQGLQETKPIEAQKAAIIDDVSKQLIAAGRPTEEANAAAQLIAAHYEARAQRFNELGSAEEMYNRDGANIKAGASQRLKELAQAAFADADTIKYRRALDELDRTGTYRGVLRLGKTPDVIAKIIGNNRDLVIAPAIVRKVEQLKHGIDRAITARLKSLLSDPIAVFDSATESGDIIAVVSVKDKNGNQVIVPISISKSGEANAIKSVYGKDNKEWFQQQVDSGRLRYLNKEKASELPALRMPNEPGEVTQKPNSSILSEQDFVNKDELEQVARGRIALAEKDAKATITLMGKADASTFIHETGHHWLDELMRDALDEKASKDLKDDAETVRKWLGADESEEISRKQHEKFARGFERYVMEGTAPSKELAGVFAKFKQWLTQIYQTVNKLRSPITDDIRDVFDRLLSANPEKTVIAPDHEPGKMLADIHEADAQHTSPEHADPVRDNIETEIDKTAKLHEPEVADAINAAKTGNIQEPVSGNPTDATAGQSPGESGTPEESGAVTSGSGEAGGKSPPVRTGAIAEPEPNKPVTDPNSTFGKPKSDLVDKAGNIRLENLTTEDDVRDVMRQFARDNDDFNSARRGVVSDGQVSDLADAMGIDARELNLQKLRQMSVEDGVPLAVRIKVGRQMLVQSAIQLRDMMSNPSKGLDDDLAFAQARVRHLMISETIAGITAEWGRAGRAFRDISGEQINDANALTEFLQSATGQSLSQLQATRKFGASLDTAAKISKYLQDSTKPSFGEQILEYWVNGLISGPATHTTYTIGNSLLSMWKAVPETLVASAIGDTVKTGESWARVKAAIQSLPSALSAAGKALKTGATTLLPGEELRGMPFEVGRVNQIAGRMGNESKSWQSLGNDLFGSMKGMQDAFVAIGELIKNGGVEDAPLIGLNRDMFHAIPDVSIKGVNIPVGQAIRVPSRAVAAIHSFFRTANYSMEKAALAYRTASEEGLNADDFKSRIADIVTNPTPEMMEDARKNATELTLMGQGGQLTQALSRLTNVEANIPILGRTKPLKFIDPFVKISSNVIEQSLLQRTPLGLFSEDIRKDLAGVNGPASRDYARARMVVGSALGVTTGLLASQGLISGSGPTDSKENAAWRMLGGNQPHSVKIGDIWYDTHRLGPLGMLIGVSADLHDFAHGMTDKDFGTVANSFVHSVAQNILDESFMRGPADLIKAVTDSDRYGKAWARNFVASFVPYSVGMSQVTRAVDPYSRQTRSIMDAIKAKIPWESQSLYPRRDIWGEPIANKDVLGVAGFSAIYESKVNNDPVNQAMLKLGIFPSQPMRKIRGVELTDQQYDDFSRMAGRMAKMRLNSIVGMPGFANLPESTQHEVIAKTIETARETTRSIIMMQNPDIIKQATDAKLKKLQK